MEYVYLGKKKKKENKPQTNPAISPGALHLILYQSAANSILKYKFNLNADVILSSFHLLDSDCRRRPAALGCASAGLESLGRSLR